MTQKIYMPVQQKDIFFLVLTRKLTCYSLRLKCSARSSFMLTRSVGVDIMLWFVGFQILVVAARNYVGQG